MITYDITSEDLKYFSAKKYHVLLQQAGITGDKRFSHEQIKKLLVFAFDGFLRGTILLEEFSSICAKLVQYVEPVNPPAVRLGDLMQHAIYFPELIRGIEDKYKAIDFVSYLRDVYDYYQENIGLIKQKAPSSVKKDAV